MAGPFLMGTRQPGLKGAWPVTGGPGSGDPGLLQTSQSPCLWPVGSLAKINKVVSLVFANRTFDFWWYELDVWFYMGWPGEMARSHARSLADDLMVKWIVLVKDGIKGRGSGEVYGPVGSKATPSWPHLCTSCLSSYGLKAQVKSSWFQVGFCSSC